MSEGPSDLSSSHLEPPSRTTELQDPGAGDSTLPLDMLEYLFFETDIFFSSF